MVHGGVHDGTCTQWPSCAMVLYASSMTINAEAQYEWDLQVHWGHNLPLNMGTGENSLQEISS